MKLILDCRERDLKTSCDNLIKIIENFKDIIIETKNLELGDMIIQDSDGNVLLMYERKSVSDLISSIKDGRYNEQSYRMNGLEHHNHNIVYLIEGTIAKTLKDKQMVYSAMFSINYYKGFSIMRSSNLDETAYIICNALMKIKKEKDKEAFYMNKIKVRVESKEDKHYSTVIKTKKNANITLDNFGEIILCQIPNVNSISAIAIMNKYKTINNLINNICEDKTCLDGITYETDNKQDRKISKTVIKNIVEFLHR